jgi:hypothetical protein
MKFFENTEDHLVVLVREAIKMEDLPLEVYIAPDGSFSTRESHSAQDFLKSRLAAQRIVNRVHLD